MNFAFLTFLHKTFIYYKSQSIAYYAVTWQIEETRNMRRLKSHKHEQEDEAFQQYLHVIGAIIDELNEQMEEVD